MEEKSIKEVETKLDVDEEVLQKQIVESERINTEYKEQLTNAGLVISGTSPDGLLTEIVEYPKNDFFVACQFHPEFKSRPQNPHPLFDGLIKTALKQKED